MCETNETMEEMLHRNHIYRWCLVSSCKVDVAAAQHDLYFSIYAGGNKQDTFSVSHQAAAAGMRGVCVCLCVCVQFCSWPQSPFLCVVLLYLFFFPSSRCMFMNQYGFNPTQSRVMCLCSLHPRVWCVSLSDPCLCLFSCSSASH